MIYYEFILFKSFTSPGIYYILYELWIIDQQILSS